MTQPTFQPSSRPAQVRASAPTAAARIGQTPKAGLEHHRQEGRLRGTPAPNEGYVLGLAARAVATLSVPAGVDHHDVVTAVASIAAKRASLVGRGPTKFDVDGACALLGAHVAWSKVAGVGHSWERQRTLVDTIDVSLLRVS